MLCLVQFFDEWTNFHVAELYSLLDLYHMDRNVRNSLRQVNISPSYRNNGLFYYIELPSREIAQKICKRSVLINRVIELWEYSLQSYQHLCMKVESLFQSTLLQELGYDTSTFSNLSWSVQVDAYHKALSTLDKDSCRFGLGSFLKIFEGPVKVENPDMNMSLLLDYSYVVNVEKNESSNYGLVPIVPCYFGRLLGRGGMREELRKYDLKKRLYIGPTSLDPALAFIMANLGQVHRKSVVLDPFVGTGSILVSLAHFDAICMGGDIDLKVLSGETYAGTGDRSIKRSIFENFEIYGLQIPELVRFDNHLLDRHIQQQKRRNDSSDNNSNSSSNIGYFDAIITDPPYGIRAGAKKTGKKGPQQPLSPQFRLNHIPPVQSYAVEEVMLDLLHNAARYLVLGGRLVYLIPTTYDFIIQDLPTHPCLVIESICEQNLSTRHSRRCVTMIKTKEYTEIYEQEYNRYKEMVLLGVDEGFGRLKVKLESALSSTAFTNDNITKNISKTCMRRRESAVRKKEQAIQRKLKLNETNQRPLIHNLHTEEINEMDDDGDDDGDDDDGNDNNDKQDEH